MKYTIEGFNQEYATTFKKTVEIKGKTVVKKIDCTDLVILRWFVDFYPNMKKMEIDGKQYAWITYSKLQKDLPLIDITKRAFSERMQKLVDFEILTYQFIKEGGNLSLYGFGSNYQKLIEKTEVAVQTAEGCSLNDKGLTAKQHRGCGSNDIGVAVQTTTIDYSINNYSIKDKSINNIEKISKKEIETEFESLWQRYPNKKGKELAYKAYCKARANGTAYDDVISGLEDYLKEIEIKKTNKQYIKHGSTWFNQGCWQDDYVTVAPKTENERFMEELMRFAESE